MVKISKEQFNFLTEATLNGNHKYYLGGIWVEVRESTLYLVAVDGRRMHVVDIDISKEGEDIPALKGGFIWEYPIYKKADKLGTIELGAKQFRTFTKKGHEFHPHQIIEGKFPKWDLFKNEKKPVYRTRINTALLLPNASYTMDFTENSHEPIRCLVKTNSGNMCDPYVKLGMAYIMPMHAEKDTSHGLIN